MPYNVPTPCDRCRLRENYLSTKNRKYMRRINIKLRGYRQWRKTCVMGRFSFCRVNSQCNNMKKIIERFFVSNEFWRKFKKVNESSVKNSLLVTYQLKNEYRDIVITFFELDGIVKSLSVIVEMEVVVRMMYFVSEDELSLILNRVPEIRAANPLCSGSESITALSYEQKIEN